LNADIDNCHLLITAKVVRFKLQGTVISLTSDQSVTAQHRQITKRMFTTIMAKTHHNL